VSIKILYAACTAFGSVRDTIQRLVLRGRLPFNNGREDKHVGVIRVLNAAWAWWTIQTVQVAYCSLAGLLFYSFYFYGFPATRSLVLVETNIFLQGESKPTCKSASKPADFIRQTGICRSSPRRIFPSIKLGQGPQPKLCHKMWQYVTAKILALS